MDGPSTTDWISAATSVVQAVAIVFAGVFAYYKFLRGRTFAYRAEPTASAELVQVGGGDALRVRAILRNTGPSKIPMRLKRLRVFALDPSTPAEVVWERVTTVDVFAEHHWVESQETIADEVLVSLQPMAGAGAPQAYRIELVMFSRPRRRLWTPWKTRVLRWSTEAVVVRERSQKGIWGKLWSRATQPGGAARGLGSINGREPSTCAKNESKGAERATKRRSETRTSGRSSGSKERAET